MASLVHTGFAVYLLLSLSKKSTMVLSNPKLLVYLEIYFINTMLFNYFRMASKNDGMNSIIRPVLRPALHHGDTTVLFSKRWQVS